MTKAQRLIAAAKRIRASDLPPSRGCRGRKGRSGPGAPAPRTVNRGPCLFLQWGDKGSMHALRDVALPALGFQVHSIERKGGTWDRDVAKLAEDLGPRLFVTWQRLYPGVGQKVVEPALTKAGVRRLFLDFGFWPHYGSAVMDPQGENAASSIVGHFDDLDAEPRHRMAINRELPRVKQIGAEISKRVARANPPLVRADFDLLIMQRGGDRVLHYDSEFGDSKALVQGMIAAARKRGRFLVIKAHPLDKALPRKGIAGDGYVLLPREARGGANDDGLAWLIHHAERVIAVNSTVLYMAMFAGKRVTALGRGWFTGNRVLHEAEDLDQVWDDPGFDRGRQERFLALLLSRQLTLEQFKRPELVADRLFRIHPELREPLRGPIPAPRRGSGPARDPAPEPLDIHTAPPGEWYPAPASGHGAADRAAAADGAMLPLDAITAFVLTWKRAASVPKTINALTLGGVERTWVWCNENAPVPKGVSLSIVSSANVGNWQRYALAGMVDTPYVLFCDDDASLLPCGIEALRRGALAHPGRVLALWGFRFLPPYDDYRHREMLYSHQVKDAEPVDLASPIGLLAPREALQAAYGQFKFWQRSRAVVGDCTADDFAASVAQAQTEFGRPIVVPSERPGYVMLPDPAPGSALARKPGRRAKLYSLVKIFHEMGWAPYYSAYHARAAKAPGARRRGCGCGKGAK